MPAFVTDTHPLVWHLIGDPRLGANAQRVLREADQGLHVITVPSIVLVETVFIGEKRNHGITPMQVAALLNVIASSPSYIVDPLDLATVQQMQTIPRAAVTGMPDRIITATALKLNLPLITMDGAIVASRIVPIVW